MSDIAERHEAGCHEVPDPDCRLCLDRKVKRLEEKYEAGERCERHGVKLQDHTLICGAPQCCWVCCREAALEQEAHVWQQMADELAEALGHHDYEDSGCLWNKATGSTCAKPGPEYDFVDYEPPEGGCTTCVTRAALADHAKLKGS